MNTKVSVDELKNKANVLFRKGKFREAFKLYLKILARFINTGNNLTGKVIDGIQRESILMNLAVSSYKMKEFEKSIKYNTMIIKEFKAIMKGVNYTIGQTEGIKLILFYQKSLFRRAKIWLEEYGYLGQSESEFDYIIRNLKIDRLPPQMEPKDVNTLKGILESSKKLMKVCKEKEMKLVDEHKFIKLTEEIIQKLKTPVETTLKFMEMEHSNNNNIEEDWKKGIEKRITEYLPNMGRYNLLKEKREKDYVIELFQIIELEYHVQGPIKKLIEDRKKEIGNDLVTDESINNACSAMRRVYYSVNHLGIHSIRNDLERSWDGIGDWIA